MVRFTELPWLQSNWTCTACLAGEEPESGECKVQLFKYQPQHVSLAATDSES